MWIKRVWRWFKHTERIDESHIDLKVLMADVSGSWVMVRPRLGWMDGVKRALAEG